MEAVPYSVPSSLETQNHRCPQVLYHSGPHRRETARVQIDSFVHVSMCEYA